MTGPPARPQSRLYPLSQNFIGQFVPLPNQAGYVGNHAVGLYRTQYPNKPGQSNYHGLELEGQKRYSNGLTILMVQFRSEFFNILNHPNRGNPGTSLGTASCGRITSTSGDSRTLQFGLKLLF